MSKMTLFTNGIKWGDIEYDDTSRIETSSKRVMILQSTNEIRGINRRKPMNAYSSSVPGMVRAGCSLLYDIIGRYNVIIDLDNVKCVNDCVNRLLFSDDLPLDLTVMVIRSTFVEPTCKVCRGRISKKIVATTLSFASDGTLISSKPGNRTDCGREKGRGQGRGRGDTLCSRPSRIQRYFLPRPPSSELKTLNSESSSTSSALLYYVDRLLYPHSQNINTIMTTNRNTRPHLLVWSDNNVDVDRLRDIHCLVLKTSNSVTPNKVEVAPFPLNIINFLIPPTPTLAVAPSNIMDENAMKFFSGEEEVYRNVVKWVTMQHQKNKQKHLPKTRQKMYNVLKRMARVQLDLPPEILFTHLKCAGDIVVCPCCRQVKYPKVKEEIVNAEVYDVENGTLDQNYTGSRNRKGVDSSHIVDSNMVLGKLLESARCWILHASQNNQLPTRKEALLNQLSSIRYSYQVDLNKILDKLYDDGVLSIS